MFFNRHSSPTFKTEKDLIIHVIRNFSKYSSLYSQYATEEWKSNPKYVRATGTKIFALGDQWFLAGLSNFTDDQEILEEMWENSYKLTTTRVPQAFVKNVNLPENMIKGLYNINRNYRLYNINRYERNDDAIKIMQGVEYKYISKELKELIDNHFLVLNQKKREEKEDETKKKLTAFLTTAAATKSVLTGNSIDDVVEQTITSDVDDAVLDYMNKLFDKK